METKTSGRSYRSIPCLLSMASVFLIITAISLNFNIRMQNEPANAAESGENHPQNTVSALSEEPVNAVLPAYTVREYSGIIGVFEENSAEPFLTVNVPVSSLPKTDAALIRQGIVVEGQAALQRLLEDYES